MKVNVIGGGLAGSEAAYRLLKAGVDVDLYEMRPKKNTEAHTTENLAELVCSNSLKGILPTTPQGTLKCELTILDSLILASAYATQVPAGGALAVDRVKFSRLVEEKLMSFTNFRLIREEVTSLLPYSIIATGPLTSKALADEIVKKTSQENLFFYDAVAPIVTKASLNLDKTFNMNRYRKGSSDYINCPMTKPEYETFYNALLKAERVIIRDFEKGDIFEGCMPIEVMASRGLDTMLFGPLRPVGLYDENGKRAYAVVQLRAEDNYDQLFNLVGFQTNLTFKAQEHVFRLIPALENAEFVRFGVMHRNTYLNSPSVLNKDFSCKWDNTSFFAGQITGVEGYMESALSGILAGINMLRLLQGKKSIMPPELTLSGSLCKYITEKQRKIQPMRCSFELTPSLSQIRSKKERREALSNRAISAMQDFSRELDL